MYLSVADRKKREFYGKAIVSQRCGDVATVVVEDEADSLRE